MVRICPLWTEYGEKLRIPPYSVRMREIADQNNSEYGHFLRSAIYYKGAPKLHICKNLCLNPLFFHLTKVSSSY